MKNSSLMKKILETGVLLFFVGGLFGFIIDSAYRSFTGQGLIYVSFLSEIFNIFIPFLPIYGFGMVIIYLIHLNVSSMWKKLAFYTFCLGSLEFLGGFLSVSVFNLTLWDYSNNYLNILGHTDLLHIFYWLLLEQFFREFKVSTEKP